MDQIRQAHAEGRPSFGSWLSIGDGIAAEVMSRAGLDWLILDQQHGGIDTHNCMDVLRAVELGGTQALVRVPSTDPVGIMRALDLGAAGVIVPMVSNAVQARYAAEAVRFPPHLDELWAVNPRAYYAVTVPHFPNMALLNGPTGPVGNFSLIDIAEAQWDYFDQLIDLVRDGRCIGISPKMASLETYEAKRSEATKRTVFASGCQSWYIGADGTPQVWPWSFAHFLDVMAKPNLDDFELIESTLNVASGC